MLKPKSWRTGRYIAGNYLFILPFLAFFLAFTAIPIVQAVFMSLFDWPMLGKKRNFIGLQNFIKLMDDGIWWQALRNTLFFAAMTAGGLTAFSLFVSLQLNKRGKGRNLYRFLFYIPVVLSVAAMGIVIGWSFSTQYGLVNALLGTIGIPQINWLGEKELVIPTLAIATLWWGFGGPMLIYLAGLQGIPKQLYEAAEIDGASQFTTTRKITLPLMAPSIFFVLVTQVIAHIQVFGQSYLITGGGPGRESYTSIFYLYQTAWRYYRMGYGSSIAISLAVIILVLTLFQFVVNRRRNEVEY
jgi:multiple sugar transport system permease protein